MKINAKSLTRAVIKASAPSLVKGSIKAYVENKTVSQFYKFIETTTIWQQINPKQQQFLLSYKPWNLDWLNLKWLIETIYKCNRPIACLILSSEEIQKKLQADIDEIKANLK